MATAVLFASSALAQQTSTGPAAPEQATSGDVVELSPFQVDASRDAGYYAENTLAGSRLNTNIGDLAASITVVTKQQMEDTASLDINDVFRYEASTEGSSTYAPSIVDRGTVKDTVAGYTFGNDGTSTTNAQSNRVRGMSAPDAAVNNYASSSRVPLDSYNTQSLEISRGPNSSIFGLGSPSGIVNQTTAQALLDRDTTSISARTDHLGSFRASIALNRSIIDGKLAIYAAALHNDQNFERKPSSDLTRRYYGAITFKPFENTVIRGFAERYKNKANRPNFFTPRDHVTPWIQAGRPVYDPVTRSVTVQSTGQVLGPYVTSSWSPGYDPAVNNIIGVNALTNTSSNLFVPGMFFDDVARPLRRIGTDGDPLDFFARQPTIGYPTQHTNPATAAPSFASLEWVVDGAVTDLGTQMLPYLDRLWTASGALPNPRPTVNGVLGTYGSWLNQGVTDKSIYNWEKYSTLAANFSEVTANNFNLEIEQRITRDLQAQVGWFRQDISDTSNNTLNSLTGATLRIDTNVNMPDGTPNPYYLLPFLSEGEGGGLDTFYSPELADNYRGMLAYNLDLRNNDGWTRWLGRHRMLGLVSRQDVRRRIERWRMNFVDGDADAKLRYTRNLSLPTQAMWSNTATMRKFYMARPGDPAATVTSGVGFYGNRGWDEPYTSQVRVWNYNTGQFEDHTLVERTVFSDAGSYQSQRRVDSAQFTLQSYLWDDRLITVFGLRKDDYKARRTTTGAITNKEGTVIEPGLSGTDFYSNGFTGEIDYDRVMNRWGGWDELDGTTRTYGLALRPFRDIGAFQDNNSFVDGLVSGLTFYYNQSDNFNPPPSFQTDAFFRPLPKPTGEGKDIGVGFNLFDGKLVARINWFEVENQNERTGAAGTLLTRLLYSDTTTGMAWSSAVQRLEKAFSLGYTLDQVTSGDGDFTSGWNSDTNNGGILDVSDEASQRAIYDRLQLPYRYYDGLAQGATQHSKSKGYEVQLTYNPTPNWTIKFTGSKSNASYTAVAPQYDAWLAVRKPVWESLSSSIPDFVDSNGREWRLGSFWSGYGFHTVALKENNDGNTSPSAYFANVVESQVALAKALEGANSPSEREYRTALITNYSFSEGRFKGWSTGGAYRWESKAAIGYYGKVGDPVNSPTVINLNDVTRPVYDSGNSYVDLWVSYRTRVFNDRVGMKIQLNVNNALEGGELRATQVNFDGTPWAFRIIDPRQFILTTTFDF